MPKTSQDTFTLLIYPALDAARGYARHLTRSPDDAEELWARTAERCWRYRETFDASLDPAAWVSTVMRNAARSMFRERKAICIDPVELDRARAFVPDYDAEIDDAREHARQRELLQLALDELPPLWADATRQVLAGRTHAEIAAAQSTTKNTIDGRTSRSRIRMRRKVRGSSIRCGCCGSERVQRIGRRGVGCLDCENWLTQSEAA